MEVDRFEDGDAPRHALDRDSDAGPRIELAVLADPERRVAESRLYCAKVDLAYGAVCDAQTRSLPELCVIRARRVEVFDRIEATQAPRDVGSGTICWSEPGSREVHRRTSGATGRASRTCPLRIRPFQARARR